MVERPALTAVLLRQCEPAMDRVIYIHGTALDTPQQHGQSRGHLTWIWTLQRIMTKTRTIAIWTLASILAFSAPVARSCSPISYSSMYIPWFVRDGFDGALVYQLRDAANLPAS